MLGKAELGCDTSWHLRIRLHTDSVQTLDRSVLNLETLRAGTLITHAWFISADNWGSWTCWVCRTVNQHRRPGLYSLIGIAVRSSDRVAHCHSSWQTNKRVNDIQFMLMLPQGSVFKTKLVSRSINFLWTWECGYFPKPKWFPVSTIMVIWRTVAKSFSSLCGHN